MYFTTDKDTKLKKSRQTTKQFLKEQYKIGENILENRITTEAELEDSQAEAEKWRDYIGQAMPIYFHKLSVHPSMIGAVITRDLHRKIEAHKREVKHSLKEIDSLINRLGLLKQYKWYSPTGDLLTWIATTIGKAKTPK